MVIPKWFTDMMIVKKTDIEEECTKSGWGRDGKKVMLSPAHFDENSHHAQTSAPYSWAEVAAPFAPFDQREAEGGGTGGTYLYAGDKDEKKC